MRWSIRTKILLILSFLLLVVVAAYLILAEKIFREDKELLIFDTNRSTTEQLANELDGSIHRAVDKIELLSELILNKSSTRNEKALAQSLFERDRDLVAFQLLFLKGKAPKKLGELVSDKKLHSLQLTPPEIRSENILPLLFAPHTEVTVENRSTDKAILYLIRVPVRIQGTKENYPLFAQALVDGRSWEESFRDNQTLAVNFAVTPSGEVFTHPNFSWILSRKNLSELEIIKKAQSQDLMLRQLEFSIGATHFLGVYRKTLLGSLTVISMIDKSTAKIASRLLLEKTILLSVIIVTGVILISLFFSATLSTPLLRLVDATRQIAQGNFDTPLEIRTHDEIGVLANAFSQMVRDLKSSRALLEDSNKQLEIKVNERTQELANKNASIRSQQDALLKSARLAAVGEMAGQAAHEVLNPLTGIISSLEHLSRQIQRLHSSPESALRVFNLILQSWESTHRAGGIKGWIKEMERPSQITPHTTMAEEDIQNLNSIAQYVEAFTQELGANLNIVLNESLRIGRIVDRMRGIDRIQRTPSRVGIHSLISQCLRATEDLFHQVHIQTETDFWPNELFVMTDQDELWQAFSNLFKNSMDAIQERRKKTQGSLPPKGLIKISTRASETKVVITIWDNGIGIREELWDRIFESYFSTKGADGTGHGLPLCRRFLRSCGGDIALKGSIPGEFAEFEIRIPEEKAT